MKTLELVQGSPEWLAARAQHFTASEAPAMLGLSPYMSRTKLLDIKKSGIAPEVDSFTQKLFDAGHETEARARTIAEAIIGEDLYPATGVAEIDGLKLLASFDGITMLEEKSWEHKILNQSIVAAIAAGDVPDGNWPQLEHQLIVSGAESVLFMCSDGTKDNCHTIEYRSRPERRKAVLDGWKQFAADIETHVVSVEAAKAMPTPKLELPSVSVTVTGSLAVASNLDRFGQRLNEYIKGIDMKPSDDQAFADAEAAIKTLSKAEEALKQAESAALEQTASIEEMRRAVHLYVEQARTTRLTLEKVVKARKEEIRVEIVSGARRALADHVVSLNQRIGHPWMPVVPDDFAGVIKGKKSLASIKDAVATELARVKIAANEVADRISINAREIADAGYPHLFPDAQQLAQRDTDALKAILAQRISAAKEAEAKRVEEATRARLEAESSAKAQPDPTATSTPAATPINTAAQRAAVVEHQDEIAAFMHARDFGKDTHRIRAVLVEFVKFQAARNLKTAA